MNPIKHFWTWFQANQTHYQNLNQLSPREQQEHLYWLRWHLQFYAPGVDFILVVPHTANQRFEIFFFTAGKEVQIRQVEPLFKTKPEIQGWVFNTSHQQREYNHNAHTVSIVSIIPDIRLKDQRPVKELYFAPSAGRLHCFRICFKSISVFMMMNSIQASDFNMVRSVLKITQDLCLVAHPPVIDAHMVYCHFHEFDSYIDKLNTQEFSNS